MLILKVLLASTSIDGIGIDYIQDYNPEWDPKIFLSEKTGRGKLTPDWKEKAGPDTYPIMCCYKLVECEFKWFGLQGTVESRIQKVLYCICM